MIETGVYFGDVHSSLDLDLILSEVNIPPAEPKTNYIDVPGRDGSLDLTETHGLVKYKDRDCKFVFTVSPEDILTFEERKTHVSNTLNGRKCKIILDKDPNYYYQGRLTVDEYLQDRNLLKIVVTARIAPYKLKQKITIATFNVTTTEKLIIIKNDRKQVVPKITCTAETTFTFEGNQFTLSAGTHQVLDILLSEYDNIFRVYATENGTVTFEYQEGAL